MGLLTSGALPLEDPVSKSKEGKIHTRGLEPEEASVDGGFKCALIFLNTILVREGGQKRSKCRKTWETY